MEIIQFEQITWNFSRAMQELLAGAANIDNNLTLDPPTVLECIQDHLTLSRTQASSGLLVHIDLSERKKKEFRPGKVPTTPAEEQRGGDKTRSCLKPSGHIEMVATDEK